MGKFARFKLRTIYLHTHTHIYKRNKDGNKDKVTKEIVLFTSNRMNRKIEELRRLCERATC